MTDSEIVKKEMKEFFAGIEILGASSDEEEKTDGVYQFGSFCELKEKEFYKEAVRYQKIQIFETYQHLMEDGFLTNKGLVSGPIEVLRLRMWESEPNDLKGPCAVWRLDIIQKPS